MSGIVQDQNENLVWKRRDKPPQTAEDHYWAIQHEIKALHQAKGADYGTDKDPFANLRRCEQSGIPAWKGITAMRIADKMSRIETYNRKGELANESFEDALLDMANYAMLALALYREAKGKSD